MARLAQSSPTQTSNERTRLQLEISDDAFDRMKLLRDASGKKTFGELVRDSLRVFEWFLKLKRDGYSVRIVKDGKETDVDLGI